MRDSDEVHLWCARTDVEADRSVLSTDERARARRFRFDEHRSRWIAARVFLRRVLSSHSGIRPELLCLRYSLHGKPVLADQGGLRFNLSHSGDLAVCAVSRSRDVGIDIEQIRPIDNLGRMFQSISSPSERTVWQTLDGTRQVDAFFNCWTVKESCAKALGTGLSTPVQSIEALNTDANPRVVACGTRLWFVFNFTPTDGYAGALAVEQWSTQAILPHVVFHRA